MDDRYNNPVGTIIPLKFLHSLPGYVNWLDDEAFNLKVVGAHIGRAFFCFFSFPYNLVVGQTKIKKYCYPLRSDSK